jgi:acyl CoA:acetate/3-ketoacid CoA transferase alpha subunit
LQRRITTAARYFRYWQIFSYEGRSLQLPHSPARAHYVKANVKVREYPDGTLACGTEAATASLDGICARRHWNPRRTNDVLQEPDNSKSYREQILRALGPRGDSSRRMGGA